MEGTTEQYDKMFIGEPYEVDREAALADGVDMEYLAFIEAGKADLEA